MNSQINIKKKLKNGKSCIDIADKNNIDLSVVEQEQIEYIKEIKKQAISQRITLRQSIRDKFPSALKKAVTIMNYDFTDLEMSGDKATRTEHIQFLKVQLDAAKTIMSMASHVLGEDILTLWAEKEATKKSENKMVYESEVLGDGRVVLTAKTDKSIIAQAGIEKLEIDIEDVI